MHYNDNIEMNNSTGLKRTALAISMAIAGMSGLTAVPNASAALPMDTTLNFTDGAKFCVYGPGGPATGNGCQYQVTGTSGSWFAMDNNGDGMTQDNEKTPISRNNGVILGQVQPASGSHTGVPDGSETPGIDLPWAFFNNTGMHFTASAPSVTVDNGTSQDIDFSGWAVTWNGIPAIDMGGGNQNCGTTSDGICVDNFGTDIGGVYNNGTGIATISCTDPNPPNAVTTCNNADDFLLTYSSVVPQADPSGFGGVPYSLRLEGVINLPGSAPITVDDSANTIIGNQAVINVLANDTVGAEGFDLDSVTVTSAASDGVTDDTNPDGQIRYTPNTGPDFTGTDTFQYTVNNSFGITSLPANVSVVVTANRAPVAVNDGPVNTSTAQLDAAPIIIDILSNDSDPDNAPGLPGGINVATGVTLVNDASGSCVYNGDGTITYSQTPPSVGGQFTCTYTVDDLDSVNPALTSNLASVTINVSATQSDWPASLNPDIIPVLAYTAGVPGDPVDSSVPAQSGSYFTMQVTPSVLIYTMLNPGPDGGLVLNREQQAGDTHPGEPTGGEETGLDEAWSFFSNTGLHITRNGGLTGNPDGTISFDQKWVVKWNGIPQINLGGSSQFPGDLGFGVINCTPAPCADQSTFSLDYAAHVEDIPGEPASGFNGVPYTAHFEGVVNFVDGTLQTSNGNIAQETRLAASTVAATDPDPEVNLQCVGDCFDYTIDGLTANKASIVLALAGGVPNNPVWRILDNNTWRNFDTTVDTVKSAPFVPGSSTCPAPGDAAYGPLTTGDMCIELTVQDNGLNDLDPAVGTISDPSGMGSGGTAGGGTTFVDTRESNTSGCTIATQQTSLKQHGEWWLLAAVISLVGFRRKWLK